MHASSSSDTEVDPAIIEQIEKNGSSVIQNLPCAEALKAGPQEIPYEIDDGINIGQDLGSDIKRAVSKMLRFIKRILLSFTLEESDNEEFKIALSPVISDNRLKEESPNTTFRETEYIDVGEERKIGKYKTLYFLNWTSE
jgi:hypothetical protein